MFTVQSADDEFYVVYTGEGKIVPEKMNLSDIIKGIDMEVKVLRGKTQKDKNIVYQYSRFCKVVKTSLGGILMITSAQ